MKMIVGELDAPWEDQRTARALLQPLGVFKVGVLGLLERDPNARSSIHAFKQACMRSLANTSFTTSQAKT